MAKIIISAIGSARPSGLEDVLAGLGLPRLEARNQVHGLIRGESTIMLDDHTETAERARVAHRQLVAIGLPHEFDEHAAY